MGRELIGGSQYGFSSPGAAAGRAIEEFLVKRALMQRQQQMDAFSIQNTQADNERADAQLSGAQADREAQRQRQATLDQAAAEDKAKKASAEANTAGMRQMIGDRLQMPGVIGQDDARSIEGMAYGAGLPVPGIVSQAMTPPKRTNVSTVDAKGHPIHKSVTYEELAAGVPEYVKPEHAASNDEPLVAIMGPDGNPVYVPRSQAVGKRPASTREQGRPVLSSDANKIGSFDNAVNQLDSLKSEIGQTGAASKVGAMLPNVVTEYTGLGQDSKQRQAVIDRVKQVIGKTLEGGVLRKEDEIKYEKILPTIGDPPAVAAKKLDGLRQAILEQKQIQIDALTKANFDTAKFDQPAAAETPEQRRKRLYDELSH